MARLGYSRSRDLLRGSFENMPDEARRELAHRVVDHLERAALELDEQACELRQRPPTAPHSTPD